MKRTQLMSYLNDQKANGYPNFRNAIANVLHKEHQIDLTTAKDLVWGKLISSELSDDIEWAQHMGPNYWANFILENHKNLPKSESKITYSY